MSIRGIRPLILDSVMLTEGALLVAPRIRSKDGLRATVRLTLAPTLPRGKSFDRPDIGAPGWELPEGSESRTWSTTSTEPECVEHEFTLEAFGPDGRAWLILEASPGAEVRLS